MGKCPAGPRPIGIAGYRLNRRAGPRLNPRAEPFAGQRAGGEQAIEVRMLQSPGAVCRRESGQGTGLPGGGLENVSHFPESDLDQGDFH